MYNFFHTKYNLKTNDYGLKTSRGFTLIELLVVIAIIGLLSTVVFASLAGTRPRARDARRLAEVKQMGLIIAIEATSLISGSARNFAGCVGSDVLASTCTGPGGISQFSDFSDPSGTSPCKNGSTATCDYSISKAGGAAAASIDDYEICFFLEEGVALGYSQGLLSITSPSGNIKTGCL